MKSRLNARKTFRTWYSSWRNRETRRYGQISKTALFWSEIQALSQIRIYRMSGRAMKTRQKTWKNSALISRNKFLVPNCLSALLRICGNVKSTTEITWRDSKASLAKWRCCRHFKWSFRSSHLGKHATRATTTHRKLRRALAWPPLASRIPPKKQMSKVSRDFSSNWRARTVT